MHRSNSVPVLVKDGSVIQIESSGGAFRVIPTTKAPEGTNQTVNANPTTVTGKSDFLNQPNSINTQRLLTGSVICDNERWKR